MRKPRIDRERLLEEFFRLVSIDSPTFGERTMGDYLKRQLTGLGFTVREDDAGEKLGGSCGNLYAFSPGNGQGEPLLFACHMDTVEPAAGKRAVMDAAGRITSAGQTVLGADDLAGVAAVLEALRSLRAHKLEHRPLEILFTVAEEVYCRGAAVFDYSVLRAKEAYVLDLTGPVGLLANRAPTILSFTVRVKGKASHAGFAPEQGVHAIQTAADAVSCLPMGRLDEETTLNIGWIEGGTATNIVPEACLLRGEIRSYTHEKALDAAEAVQAAFADAADRRGARIEWKSEIHCHAYRTPENHPVVSRFQRACGRLDICPELTGTFGGSDNNILARHGITGVVLACAMNGCHSCEEYTTADELERIAAVTQILMTSEAD